MITPAMFAREVLALQQAICRCAEGVEPPAAIDELESRVTAQGSDVLSRISRQAITRLLAQGPHAVAFAGKLFTDRELYELTHAIATARAAGDLLGRTEIRKQQRQVWARHLLMESTAQGCAVALREDRARDAPLLSPESALRYFLSLVPKLGVDPGRYAPDMMRTAFTLAVDVGTTVLQSVKDVIATALQKGESVHASAELIDTVLQSAGVDPQGGYAEMVFRTNMMDAYHVGEHAEVTQPDVIDTFPAWEYTNPTDSRSRPEHAAKNGNYYPVSLPFVVVRGTDIKDAANCRCVPIYLSVWEWRRLQSQGARLQGSNVGGAISIAILSPHDVALSHDLTSATPQQQQSILKGVHAVLAPHGLKARELKVQADVTNDILASMGAGHSGGRIQITPKFLDLKKKTDEELARQVAHGQKVAAIFEKEIDELKTQMKTAKGQKKMAIQRQITDKELEIRANRSPIDYVMYGADDPLMAAAAHEAGHLIDEELQIDFQSAIRAAREAGELKEEDYELSMYGHEHPAEMFAEITAALATGQESRVPLALRNVYRQAIQDAKERLKHQIHDRSGGLGVR